MFNNKLFTPKAILFAIIIISLGTMLGVALYFLTFKKPSPIAMISVPTSVPTPKPSGSLVPNPTPEPSLEIDTNDWLTYRNEKYGYEFHYSLDYILKEVGNNYLLLRKTGNKEIVWPISVTIKNNRSDTNDFKLTFREFTIELIISSCVADGSDTSIYCTKATEIKPITNKNKINGYEIYINEATENVLSNKISNRVKGPIFVMDISKQTNNLARGIFFDFDDEKKILSEQEKQKLIDQILSTFKFIEE